MIETQKLNYIDAVRGWAIILVITCHCGSMFPGLPYPVKKLTNFGWHGVQLFFLASAVTLLMSWNRTSSLGSRSVSDFFTRRFLRIAPMYYLGAAIYYVAEPPLGGFELGQLVRSLTFINSWSPDWIPTTPGWLVVPGGWSIGVEFTFYALFPFLATRVTSLSRACLLFAIAVAGAWVSNVLGSMWLTAYPEPSAWNFLYFWFPNQFPIFALGIILYFCIKKFDRLYIPDLTASAIIGATVLLELYIAERPSGVALFLVHNPFPPILLASVGFFVFIFTLSKSSATMFVHQIVQKIGMLSFSAYVLHFLFIHSLVRYGLIDGHAEGYPAIGSLALLWILAMSCTFLAATFAYKFVERPGMDLARRLSEKRVGLTRQARGAV